MKVVLAFAFLLAAPAYTAEPPTKNFVKVKKSDSAKSNQKPILRKIGSDERYDYYEVTPAELKIIEAARKAFAEAQKLPPPPDSLQKKMQDQVGGSGEDDRR